MTSALYSSASLRALRDPVEDAAELSSPGTATSAIWMIA